MEYEFGVHRWDGQIMALITPVSVNGETVEAIEQWEIDPSEFNDDVLLGELLSYAEQFLEQSDWRKMEGGFWSSGPDFEGYQVERVPKG